MSEYSIPGLLPAMLLACMAVVELFLRLPFLGQIETVNRGAMRALSVVRSPRISDHWKEKVLPSYAGEILRASLALGGLIIALGVSFVLIYLPLARMATGDWESAWLSLGSVRIQLCLLIIGVVWAVIRTRGRRKDANTSDYTTSAQMLHRLALGSEGMKSLLDDLDRRLAGRRASSVAVQQPVYVTSLARAGTTVVLEALYSSGCFTAQTYRAMPFVMAPWAWGGLSRSGKGSGKGAEQRERAHGDRLKISVDSPEAFEEVFWSTYAGREVRDPDGLRPVGDVPVGLLERYRSWVQRIVARGAVGRAETGRYLCKNNNNILRVPWLLQAFPDAQIVTPFRHPADHVRSLLGQHQRFLERHAQDPFSLEYMDWLGHHEFGAHFLPFKMGADQGSVTPVNKQALLEPAFWVDYWTRIYGYLVEAHSNELLWLDYDRLCDAPEAVLEELAKTLFLPDGSLQAFTGKIHRAPARPDPRIEAALTPECLAIYERMQALNRFAAVADAKS